MRVFPLFVSSDLFRYCLVLWVAAGSLYLVAIVYLGWDEPNGSRNKNVPNDPEEKSTYYVCFKGISSHSARPYYISQQMIKYRVSYVAVVF